MPQLDIVTFLSQYFWTSFFFIFLFFTLQKYILPRIGRILFYREKKLIEFQSLEEKGFHFNSFRPGDGGFLSPLTEFSSNLGDHLLGEGVFVFEKDRNLFFLPHSPSPKYFNKVTLFLKNSSIFPFHRRIHKTGEKSIFYTYNFYTAFSFLLENWKQYNYILFLTKLNLLSISDFNKKTVDEKMENWEEEQSFLLLEGEVFSQFRFFFVVSELVSFDEKS